VSPDFRKVALIAASLGLLVSLFLALSPDDGDDAAPTATVEAQATAAPAEAASGSESVDVNAASGDVVRATVQRGADVVVNVTAAVADRVHVHGYDLSAEVAPGTPAKIAFRADTGGRFEIELEERGGVIAELTVEP